MQPSRSLNLCIVKTMYQITLHMLVSKAVTQHVFLKQLFAKYR